MIQPDSAPPAGTQPLLRVRGLSLRRGERLLFADLTFSVMASEVLLLRGPNGVGKSTLLLALAGIVRPEAGTIEHLPDREGPAPQRGIHFMGYQHGLKSRLTVAENLSFWRSLYGPGGTSCPAALAETGIAGLSNLEAGLLSSGQLRRLSLARLLVSERPVWLLDEPTAALDAEGEALVGRLVDRHCARGGIAVVATHHDLALSDPQAVRTLTLGGAA